MVGSLAHVRYNNPEDTGCTTNPVYKVWATKKVGVSRIMGPSLQLPVLKNVWLTSVIQGAGGWTNQEMSH